MKHRIVGACLALALCCGGAPGDDKPGSKDAAAVGKSLAALAAAYNARDAKAIGEVFTTTGEFVDGSGNVFQGREKISGEFAALFQVNPKNTIEVTTDDVRRIETEGA